MGDVRMRRRSILKGMGAVLALQADFLPGFTEEAPTRAASRVRPRSLGWPTDADWTALNQATNGHLSQVTLPKLDDSSASKLLSNPFAIADQPGLTQSSGWLDAWRSSPSAYVVAAESAADVAAAVRFASARNVRLVVKGCGHSYIGGSNAPDSLLVWTRRMDAIHVHDAFTPAGSNRSPVPAVSVGAGCMWLHVYQAVTGGAGRYVQGGGCTTVGVAGLVQGGGFGSFSKGFGTAAASLLEAEIVTADGETRIVNEAREPDLFWALKGGGGGTFGIVTRLTLATHPLPETFGTLNLNLRARSDDAYRRLLARFVDLYARSFCNPNWGEQVRAGPNNRLVVSMLFQGLTKDEVRAAWSPLIDFANANGAEYEGQNSLDVSTLPTRNLWNAWLFRFFARSAANFDSRPDASWTDFWWAGDGKQVGAYWHAYSSAWMPAALLKPENHTQLVEAWFAASRHWSVAFHFNKGLAGAPPAAIEASKNTATNPDVLDAFALAIIASEGPPAFDGLPQPDRAAAGDRRDRVHAAMVALRAAAPYTGAYVNECDFFQLGWQKAFWGGNYQRLADIKRRYDPEGLFVVHHGVGSEAWSDDGFTRTL
jgi:FAD/FMN-containing dehydrogenase